MPGITGIVSRGPAERYQQLAAAMVRSMEHETFYTSGTYFVPELGVYAGWVAHGNLSAAGRVFLNEQRDVALILAGECFMAQEVRSALLGKGHDLGDTNNYLVHLYEEEGERFVEELNGLFTGLIIDERRQKIFLFNDRYGSERMYWYQDENAIYFASEAKALLCVRPELRGFDDQGVAEFLTFGCTLGDRTLFRDVQMLPGGSVWSFENGACRKRRYFSSESWEARPVLSADAFTAELEKTFNRVLPRYFESQSKVGISLTGGLDSRMIMACRPNRSPEVVSYTFSGETGKTRDDRLAEQVATVCGVSHRLLRIGPDFFSDFSSYLDRTVYVTDGYFGATGAHEIYLNKQAREVAPVRLTGNYGSEVLRGISTFKAVGLSPALFNPEFSGSLHCATASLTNESVHPITFAAFREIPWNLFGGLAASRSQVTFRTPYLDNELVALAYQAPLSLRQSPWPSWHLINENSRLLGAMATDRRAPLNSPRPAAILKRLFSEATFKLDYLNNEGWPDWLGPFDSVFTRVTSGLRILGLHKYLHYRTWFRRELAGYLRDATTEACNRPSRFWNQQFVKQIVKDHISGRKNYVREINAVLTLDAVDRLLFRSFPDDLAGDVIYDLESHSRSRPEENIVFEKPAKHAKERGTLESGRVSEPKDHQLTHSFKAKALSGNEGAALRLLPTFVGIGSMRCGSTWLYEVLKLHPDIRMSDCKEMDFFFMPQMLQHDLSWYEAHFRPHNGSEPKPVRGEISPRYARLKAWQVQRIAQMLPELRIILTLRHPIERVWSQTLYDFGRLRGQDVGKVRSFEFLQQLERARNKFSSDYLRMIKIWANAFGRDSLHITIFDQLREDPETFVDGILKHIGASTPWQLPTEFVQKRVWSTSSLVKQRRDIPELVEWYIADQLLDPTQRLNQLLDGRVSGWVEELRTIRGKTRLSWRILREVNRTMLSVPERLAYDSYHVFLDFKLWRRWRHLRETRVSDEAQHVAKEFVA